MNKNIKLAKFGGQKVRKVAMPSRFSFGRKEKLEINIPARYTKRYKQIKNTYGNSMYSYFLKNDI